jgi:class 3 adenylate cyclase
MESPPLERKLVAILAADVASYSRLMEIDEEGTLATLSAFRLVRSTGSLTSGAPGGMTVRRSWRCLNAAMIRIR